MCSKRVLMKNILDCYDFFFQKRSPYNRSSFLIRFYLSKFKRDEDKQIKETIIQPKSPSKLKKLNHLLDLIIQNKVYYERAVCMSEQKLTEEQVREYKEPKEKIRPLQSVEPC